MILRALGTDPVIKEPLNRMKIGQQTETLGERIEAITDPFNMNHADEVLPQDANLIQQMDHFPNLLEKKPINQIL